MVGYKKILVASKSFSLKDQVAFAEFSGDFNPIHVDPIAARRSIAGQCVVHGIHGLMWALDSFISFFNLKPSAIKIKFKHPIFLDDEVLCYYDNVKNKLQITSGEVILYDISLSFDSEIEHHKFNLSCKLPLSAPLDNSISDLEEIPPQDFFYVGQLDLAKNLFPNMVAAYSIEFCAEISSISEVVGMRYPGLRSFFLSANINLRINKFERNIIVQNIDARFNLMKIKINAASLICDCEVLLIKKPYETFSLIDLQAKISKTEFHEINALIIGGSRGLGESVAKIIALGGGKSLITYSTGYDDCLMVANQVSAMGQKCSIAKIKMPEDIHLISNLGNFNQVYYFPTPKIFGKRNSSYDVKLYESFYEIYVNSFNSIIDSFAKKRDKVVLFYPSTEAINQPLPELEEYIDAKIAGEKLCKKFDGHESISIYSFRIPRTGTDQTISLINAESENPNDVMLPVVRKMTSLIQL